MSADREEIAIIGMAGRFSGARDVEEFWRNIRDGVESIRPFTREELAASGVDPAVLGEPGYVNSGAVLDDADCFDAAFFGCTPREAELMDPQQRVFLEVAWEACEHAGYDPAAMPGAVGVFAGIAQNTYLLHNLAPHPDLARSLAHYQLTLGNEKDFLATRAAYKLNLRGPCLSVQTACSSSLVAVHLACQSLLAGECDAALVGGGRIRVPLHAGYHYEEGGIPSPDGKCRPFAADARGAVAGSGMAAVVLKRLSDALADGDTIHAIIKGTAINNDGSAKAGFTAPSVEGQAGAIAQALAMAGVDAESIGCVEAHGTGTSLGDPIEIAGLTRAFRETTSARGFCAIGSVKGNIGHLDAGAGVAGLIKATLALKHRQLPPSLHCAQTNPQIDFASSPFFVNTALRDWPGGDSPRHAGVSSFGIGGTNAHAIIEEAPSIQSIPSTDPQILVLSAKTEPALAAAATRLAAHLRDHPASSLADIAHTLQTGRQSFEHRFCLAAATAAEAAEKLATPTKARRALPSAPEVVFMFPGQGAQFAGMGTELHAAEPVFRAALDRCSTILGFDLHTLDDAALAQTLHAQPALFAIEWALAQLWRSRGIAPAAMIGHSVGEYVAACLAGVFTLETGLRLVAERARLTQSMPPGAMLAVRLPEEELRPLLGDRLDLAAINAPSLCVAAGPHDDIAQLEQTLKARHVAHVRLETSHAFHSAMMDPVIEPFTALVRETELHPPTIPFISGVTGKWITDGEATNPGYWASHLRQPVRFAAGLATLAEDNARLLLEVGPGETLAPLARQQCGAPVVGTLSASRKDEQLSALRALGELWCAGVPVDWTRLHASPRRRVPLPTYAFARERHWIEAPARTPVQQPEETRRLEAGGPKAAAAAVGGGALARVQAILSKLSGVPVERLAPDATFLELGFDSLFLTQANLAFQKEFRVALTFRQLLEELDTPARLAAHLAASDPSDMSNMSEAPPAPRETPGPFRPADTSASDSLTPQQHEHLDDLVSRYTARTASSKALIARHRPHLADPRAVLGFKRLWKEMVYPIVVERSAGARLWDIDGHEYIDLTMGFGTHLFGHLPDFVREAMTAQLARGIEIGPQTPLAGEVAEVFCQLTGNARAGFCNTGSEAVLAALRIARTVTGRSRIALFAGSYHGIFDEVLVRPGPNRPTPVAPGIPASMLENVTVLEYGRDTALDFLRAHAGEFAAVLVEPVQSRNPGLQPREFLHALRGITAGAGAALIFDEMITGLRCHPRGAQGWFGVKADIATYGKIPGGGLPLGIVAGEARYLDALDGGAWQYGDDSFPEVGVTFFAGTFVRHPLALAASRAVLRHLREQGPELHEQLNSETAELVSGIEEHLRERDVPIRIARFGSMFYLHIPPELKHANLLFAHLRLRGIHLLEGRACFLSTAHTAADREAIAHAFAESFDALLAGGFLSATAQAREVRGPSTPPELVTPSSDSAQDDTEGRASLAQVKQTASAHPLAFSLYFFGNYPAAFTDDKYKLLFESARVADREGFSALWIPERHFHAVGGFSPNPSVLAAALARETTHLQLRAGSVVVPLHHPIRVAEEWALVDNLSRGRTGIAVASGWHPDDFVFAPEAFEKRRELCAEGIAKIRALWRGDSISVKGGAGNDLDVRIFPMPMQAELPIWLTCVKPESYAKAGEMGCGVLAQMQNQSFEEIAEKIALYREAHARAGHDPARAHVTMLLHTFVTDDAESARAQARKPMREYLRSHIDISQRRFAGDQPSAADIDFLLDRAFADYARGKAFIGTPESCAEVAEGLRSIGVDEVGCLIDFGISPDAMLASLPHLCALKRRFDPEQSFPLTESQRGLWALASLSADASRAYNETSVLDLRGPLDIARLDRALQGVVDRHAAVRATFSADGESQTVRAKLSVTLKNSGDEWIAETRGHVFDLTHGQPLRARLVKIAPDHQLLVLTFHHLLGNGPSYGVFFDELCALYDDPAARLEPAMQLGDFVAWRSRREPKDAERFWLGQFPDGVPALDLPLDHPRPPVLGYRGGREAMTLDAAFTADIRKTGAQLGGSLFMTLFAAWKTLLHRLSGQDDLVVGVAFEGAARQQPGGARLIANTTNLLPLRSRIDDTMTFRQMVAATRSLVLEAGEHQDFFMGRLVEKLSLRRDPSRAPLIGVTFNFESGKFAREAAGLAVELVNDDPAYLGVRDTAMFELYLNVAEKDGELLFRLDYNRDLFESPTVRRWLGHLRTLLRGIIASPESPVRELPLLDDAERERILVEWNDTAHDFPATPLDELFAAQAARTPDAVAISFEAESLTFAELNARAEALSRHVEPGTLVGVFMERSPEMVVALLAVLKAGSAYIPLDPAYPAERVAFMIADAAMPLILTHGALQPPSSDARILRVDAPLPPIRNPQSAIRNSSAYAIYTSGSTGQPKAALIPHRAICNHMHWMQRVFPLGAGDRVLQKTPFGFDASVWEFWAPLLSGAELVMARPGGHADTRYLAETIRERKITTLQVVPSLLRVLLDEPELPRCRALRRVFCGGEPLAPDLVERLHALLPGVSVTNLYGPTECAIDSSFWICAPGEQSIPIGRPIDNAQCHIVDRAMQPVPVGVPGELLIGGAGLATGYLNRPELTAEKFLPGYQLSTINYQPPVYRTGDLARWREDGAIEFLGRIDLQVKIRGVRVELGEIEEALKRQPTVADCAVILREERLIAYVVGSASADALRMTLPEAMIPQAFVSLEKLPRLPNGKLDRAALPEPAKVEREYAAPDGPLEEQLAAIWSEILGCERVGRLDNFFDLGGDSLSGLRIINRVRDLLGEYLSVMAIFEAPTVASLALDLRKSFAEAVAKIEGAPGADPSAPAPGIARIARDSRRVLRSTLGR